MPTASGFGYYPYHYPTTKTSRLPPSTQLIARASKLSQTARTPQLPAIYTKSTTRSVRKPPTSTRITTDKRGSVRSGTFLWRRKSVETTPRIMREVAFGSRLRRLSPIIPGPKFVYEPPPKYVSRSITRRLPSPKYVPRRRNNVQLPPTRPPNNAASNARPREHIVERRKPRREEEVYYIETVSPRRPTVPRRSKPVEYVYEEEIPQTPVRKRRRPRTKVIYVDEDQHVPYGDDNDYIYVDEDGYEVNYMDDRRQRLARNRQVVLLDEEDQRRGRGSDVVYLQGANQRHVTQPSVVHLQGEHEGQTVRPELYHLDQPNGQQLNGQQLNGQQSNAQQLNAQRTDDPDVIYVEETSYRRADQRGTVYADDEEDSEVIYL